MPQPLPPEALGPQLDPASLNFESTAELQPLEEVLGQQRAVEAISFGISMRQEGYNLFVFGTGGTGRHEVTRRFLEQQAADDPVPADWCYIHDSAAPEQPRAIALPAGRGADFKRDMERLVEDLRIALPAAFESDDYRTRRQSLEEGVKEKHGKALEVLADEARAQGIALIRTPTGLALVPLKDGELLPPEEFQKLPEEEKQRIAGLIQGFQTRLEVLIQELPRWEKEHREQVRSLGQEVCAYAVSHLIDDLRRHYEDLPQILRHLKAVEGRLRSWPEG